MQKKKVSLNESTVLAILNYLYSKPMKEVEALVLSVRRDISEEQQAEASDKKAKKSLKQINEG